VDIDRRSYSLVMSLLTTPVALYPSEDIATHLSRSRCRLRPIF